MNRVFGGLLIFAALLCGVSGLTAADPAFDPRLGQPLEKRARPTLGSDQAPLVVIEVSSFICPHCQEFRKDTFPTLKQQYIDTGKVQWVMVNAADDPETAHELAFVLARCLNRQHKFPDFSDLLFEQGPLPPPQLLEAVKQRGGFDEAALGVCLADPSIPREIAADFADYRHLKVPGTPTFFVRRLRSSGARSEARIVGNLPLGYFQRTFNQMLRLTP